MEWKFKDGEKVYYRFGVSVYYGVVEYTSTLPAKTDDGEECYHVRSEDGQAITCACSLYREKEAAVKDALAEIHRLYWPAVHQYFSCINALRDL